MSAHWGDKEVRELLTLRAEDEISRHITGTVKDGPILERLAQQLRGRGFARDKAQVTSKLKCLRKKFHQVNDHNGRSGRGRLDWPYFDLCYSIWGTGHSANPIDPPSNAEDPASPEVVPAVSPSPSSSVDAGVPSGLDTEASNKNGESAPHDEPGCRPPQKRRRLTKAQVVTKEIKDLLLAMDREDAERDRLRFERVHEEQLRRGGQELEMAAQEDFGNMFRDIQREMQNQASLLRELIARLPAPVPQRPALATQHQTSPSTASKVENFKDQICNDAVLLVSKHLPNKLAELDNLLRAEEFNLTDLSQVHVELDIPIPDPPKDDEEDEEEGGKEKKKKKPPKCGMQNPNEKIVALVRRVKPELSSMKETCIMLSTWITYLIPKIEDGNDFGVAVQEKVLERIAAIKTKVEGFQTSITKYFTERGDTVAKASKDTHVMDYRQLVHEKDEAAYLDIKTMIMDIRGYYIELLELIVKNVEKVTSPKGEEKSYSMY